MKTMELQTNSIDKFVNLVMQGVECWIEAGKLVVQMIDDDPDFAEKVSTAHPEISTEMVFAFDRIGRNLLHPKLLISDSPGAQRLRKLPISVQEKYLKEPVELLICNAKGNWETLHVDVHNLTLQQAKQVFSGDGMRTPAAQRAWIEDHAAQDIALKSREPYRVVGRRLIIMEPCQLTAKQMASLLASME